MEVPKLAFFLNRLRLLAAVCWKRPAFRVGLVAAILLALVLIFTVFFRRPAGFPERVLVTIPAGATLNQTADLLVRERVISSPFIFKSLVLIFAPRSGVKAGDYYFEKPLGVFSTARRLAGGRFGLTPIRVTVPEGSSNKEIAEILSRRFGGFDRFDRDEFLAAANEKEGYLFPDTYFFFPNVKPLNIVEVMEDNFFKKIAALEEEIRFLGRPLKEVVIMASLLEEEARSDETRRVIAGILWKRLAIGMPLQVDAVFPYINGKNTFELTTDDLSLDSPYNTYRFAGFPPGPITNPGLSSIKAAVNPIKTPYLYYLSDRQGNMHYALTLNEHAANKNRYLRQ